MALLFSPWFWLAVLLALASTFGGGYHLGGKHAQDHAAAEQLEIVEVTHVQEDALEAERQKVEQEYEKVRQEVRVAYFTIKERIDENIEQNPVYSDCSLDDDGLQLYNAKPDHYQTPAASGANGPLPGSAGSAGRPSEHDLAKQPGTLSNVLRLPGATQSVGRLGETPRRPDRLGFTS